MKYIKILIVSIFVIILLIITAMVIIVNINNNTKIDDITTSKDTNINEVSNNESINEEILDDGGDIIYDEEVHLLTNKHTFFLMEKMIRSYFMYLNAGNAQAVYDILDNVYLNQNGINKDNVLHMAKKDFVTEGLFKAKEIYFKDAETISIYYIYGILDGNNAKIKIYFTLYENTSNNSYKLKPINEQEYLLYTRFGQIENYVKEFQRTDYNKRIYESLTDEEIAQIYFEDYINNARYYPQDAYNSLDEEYRDLRFGSYENYQNYLIEKRLELEALDRKTIKTSNEFANEKDYLEYTKNLTIGRLEKYYFFTEGDTNYCICEDTFDNHYIFKIANIMDYKLMLDSYTINLPKFLQEYEEGTAQEKVILNIQKVFEAINNNDYKYVYNKLDEDYRARTVSYENFRAYMGNNLFVKNIIELGEYTQEENLYKYELTIIDKNEVSSDKIKMTVTMQLKEDTNYTIKFE